MQSGFDSPRDHQVDIISNLYKNKAIILNERIGYEKVHLKKVISIVDDSLIKDVDDYNELTKVYLKNIYYIKKK